MRPAARWMKKEDAEKAAAAEAEKLAAETEEPAQPVQNVEKEK